MDLQTMETEVGDGSEEQTKRGVERDRIKWVFLPTGKSFRRNSDPAIPEKGKRYPRS
jgi:hypothetical protein